MARIITEADLPAKATVSRRNLTKAERRYYPWPKWSNGKLWQIFPGEDFDIPTASMRAALYQHAGRRRIDVVTYDMGDGSLAFRFIHPQREDTAA